MPLAIRGREGGGVLRSRAHNTVLVVQPRVAGAWGCPVPGFLRDFRENVTAVTVAVCRSAQGCGIEVASAGRPQPLSGMGDDEAQEVDTDDELKGEAPAAAGAADEVDTDEDLRQASASTVQDRKAWCLWGEYKPAKLKTVQQGMYQVKFEDGSTRWATCSELVLPDQPVPLRWLKPGAPILRPELDADGARPAHYVQGTLVRTFRTASGEKWEVRRDDAEGADGDATDE